MYFRLLIVVVPTLVITTFITKNRSFLLKWTVCVILSWSAPLVAVPTQTADRVSPELVLAKLVMGTSKFPTRPKLALVTVPAEPVHLTAHPSSGVPGRK